MKKSKYIYVYLYSKIILLSLVFINIARLKKSFSQDIEIFQFNFFVIAVAFYFFENFVSLFIHITKKINFSLSFYAGYSLLTIPIILNTMFDFTTFENLIKSSFIIILIIVLKQIIFQNNYNNYMRHQNQ